MGAETNVLPRKPRGPSSLMHQMLPGLRECLHSIEGIHRSTAPDRDSTTPNLPGMHGSAGCGGLAAWPLWRA